MLMDDDNQLKCPVCGETQTHINQVLVAGRFEDEREKYLQVDALNAAVFIPDEVPGVQGRRHRIALQVDCEFGHTSYLIFRQHKGCTLVEVAKEEAR